MKFSHEWLKDLVEINQTPEKLAEFLSLRAFETEVNRANQEFFGIIVAKVTKIEKHPNADRLRIIELTDGKNTIGPIVCGAWNFEVGAIVALALPGAVIPETKTVLSKVMIRGIESQGMICSAKELSLGTEAGGIMLLDSKHKIGQAFSVMDQDRGSKIIFDISIPANRPDLISYRGVAWEIAALTGSKYKIKPLKSQISNLKSKLLKIRISEPSLCKQYVGLRMANIQISPSPKFIQDRLKLSGFRPINNVVDIANYVMLEVGQPLHAFDAAKIIGAINVRKAYVNETIKTLDGLDRKLNRDVLVIADNKKAIAIAGVIGGSESAVSIDTCEIILEAANFNSVSVRRTAKALGLRTDASTRFEKSLPINLAHQAAEYAAVLLTKYAGAKPLEYLSVGAKPTKKVVIEVDPIKVDALLGVKIPIVEQKKILSRFGFGIHPTRNKYHVTVPFWRPDVRVWQDLAEEIIRFKSLENIPVKQTSQINSSHLTDPRVDGREQVKDLLVGMGFNELYTYSFVSESDLNRWQINKRNVIEIANPLSEDQQYLRPNLALNVLKVAEQNTKEYDDIKSGKYFEIGNIFWREQNKIFEQTYLFMLSFPKTQKRIEEFVGDFKQLAVVLGIEYEIKQHKEQLAEIIVADKSVGHIGTISDVSGLEWIGVNLDFEEFIRNRKTPQYKRIVRFPSISMDSSILISEDISWIEIKKTIIAANQKLVSEIKLIEGSYQGKEVPPYKKSMTFRIIYQSEDRTLTNAEASQVHGQILETLKSKFSVRVRD